MAPTSLASYQGTSKPTLEDELPYIINHVFLPPKLPQSSDSRIERNEVLLEALRLACHEFVKQHVRHASVSKDGRSIQLGENWENIEGMLATTGVIYTSRTDADVLEKQMNNMWPGEVITLYIQAQNAGVIIRKPATNNGKEISIESFEAAAPTAKVMSGERRMLVNYPGPSVTLPDTVFHNPGFAHELAQFLADMNYSEMKNAQRTTQKAQGEHKEIRDSNRCIYITELLTGLLQGVGGVATRSLERIEKRIADDVVWKKALLPWRRSPFWLVMRVALQTSIVRDADGGFRGYKALMLFFMSRVLDVAVRRNVSSDLLRVMSGKISRRAFKLKSYGGEDIYGVLPVAGKSVENAVAELERRWASVQERHVQSMTRTWDPAALDIGNAAKLTMTNSSGHIEAILNAHKNGRPMAQYRGGTGTGLTNRIDPLNFDPDRLGHYISEATKKGRREKLVLLADFEDWVASRAGGLSDWTAGHLSTDGNRAISTAINSYYSFACLAYGKNPERLSIMLLTVLEMWIALDKITVELFPTLRDYPAAAELNLETLQKLLLPRRAQMGRLAAAEAYLLSRRAGSRYKSIFSDDVSDSSFSVRYVLYSAPHLELIRAIEDAARTERNAREQEMLAANTAYAEQMRLYNSKAGCTYNQWGGHDRLTCDRCQHKHIADGLSVAIHEWPLPEGRSEKYAVAFELDPPAAFAAYRDTTYTLMAVVFSPEMDAGRDEPLCTFARYAGLRAHSRADGAQTVVWASATKSFSQSHYGSQAAPTDAAAIFQKHALQYRLHDAARKTWVRAALNRCSVASAVTLRLPDGPYGNLQYALDGTAHTSNRVVAGQDDCDPALLLAEYDAFCTLRAGHRLQWLSIARELAARVLAFGRAEVWLLVMQAAWEAGPPGDAAPSAVCRDAHVHLQDSRYCGDVIAAMEGMLGTIESNWCQGVAARTLIVITTRLLSVNQDSAVADRALLLLRRLRAVAFAWTQQLVRQNQGAPDAATQQLLLEMAITTHMTFNVDSAFMSRVLSREEDISSFIQCLIIVHDNTPADITSLPYTTQLLLDQDNQLSHDIQSSVVSALQSNRRGLDHAIKQAWSVYPGYDKADKMSLWTIPFPYFTSSTVTRTITLSAQDGGGEKLVQVDILTGQLLINGAPFGRLPTEYTSHPTYSRIFGQDILDVCPCGGSGEMKYQMKQKMGGNEVFFALRLRNLVIRLQTPAPESHTFEIITNTLFKDDFPDPLVQNFAHCLNLNTGTLEFRPLDGIWRSSAENWSIDLSDQPIFMQRVIDGTTSWMADYRSKAASMISKLLSAIEEKSNLQIILHPMPSPHRLVVHLHRYSLDFALNDRGLLECTSLPGLVIDSRQDMGTMIGLSNYLVLCEIGQLSKYGRHVLIPRGKIEYTMGLCDKHNNGHTVTRISTTGMSKVAYHKYKIDAILGRLVGNTTMASRLYQNHLHALTSFCLPDPLTGITGTQTSLENLQQASMSSFQKITMHEVELLESIAKLTPIRVWYPDHLQVMQTVEWDGHLPATSQHAGFLKTALSILEHWEKISFFYPNESQIEWKKAFEKHLKSPMHLRKRAEIRNSVWFSETSDTYDSGTDITHVPYVQAKIEKKGQLEAQSQHIATLAVNWSRDLQVPQEIFQDFRTWDGKILGTNSVEMPLGYYTELHEVPLGSIWMPLHKQFSQATRDDRFGMAFLLGVLAYKSAASMEQLETLLAFATIPEITRNLNSFLEQYSSFDLKDGFTFQDDAISSFIRSYCLRTFRDSPQFSLPSNFGEQPYQTQSRRQRTYNAASNTEVSEAVRFISVYRDYERFPPIQYELGLKSLELIRFYPHTRTALDDRLGSFYRNRKLREHITRINALLDSHLPRRFTSHCVKVSPYNYEYFSGYRMPVSVDITLSRLVENLAPLAPKSTQAPWIPRKTNNYCS
ncbi:hypothetical protein DFH27DRAFT_650380 [Peziza echinospora]|nr:hypothetical protein DFH27DRAFT_650380 [Peziza echinospora]